MADRIDLDQMARELCRRVENMNTIHDDDVRTAIRAAMSEALHRAHDGGADGSEQEKLLREENTRLKHKLADATSLIIRLRASREQGYDAGKAAGRDEALEEAASSGEQSE